jgi:hypothetical protein
MHITAVYVWLFSAAPPAPAPAAAPSVSVAVTALAVTGAAVAAVSVVCSSCCVAFEACTYRGCGFNRCVSYVI